MKNNISNIPAAAPAGAKTKIFINLMVLSPLSAAQATPEASAAPAKPAASEAQAKQAASEAQATPAPAAPGAKTKMFLNLVLGIGAAVVAVLAVLLWFKTEATPPSADEIATAVARVMVIGKEMKDGLKPPAASEAQATPEASAAPAKPAASEAQAKPAASEAQATPAPAAADEPRARGGESTRPDQSGPRGGVRFLGSQVVRPEAAFWRWEKQGDLIFPVRKNRAGYPAPFMNKSRTPPPKGLFPNEPAGEWVIGEFLDPSGELAMEGWAKISPRP